MYQRNATTALKPIFPAHNQGNEHMYLESTGTQTFILNMLKKNNNNNIKKKSVSGVRLSLPRFTDPKPPPPPAPPKAVYEPSPRASGRLRTAPPTPSPERSWIAFLFGGGSRRGTHPHGPPLPKRASGRAALRRGDLCAKLRGGGSGYEGRGEPG